MIQWCCGQRNQEGNRKHGWGGDMEYRKQAAKSACPWMGAATLHVPKLDWRKGNLVALAAFVARGSRSKLTEHSHLYFYHCSFLSCWQTVWEEAARQQQMQVLREVEENKHEDSWAGRKTHLNSQEEHHPQTFINIKHNLYSTVQTSWVTPSSLHSLLPRSQKLRCHSCTQETTWQGTSFKLYLCYQQPVSGKHLFPFL